MKSIELAALAAVSILVLTGCASLSGPTDEVRALEHVRHGCTAFYATDIKDYSDPKAMGAISGPFVEAALIDPRWESLVDDSALLTLLEPSENARRVDGLPTDVIAESYYAMLRLDTYCNVLAAKGDGTSD